MSKITVSLGTCTNFVCFGFYVYKNGIPHGLFNDK